MSATPRELATCAAELLKTAESEPHYRAVCSRSYYAAFHAAKAFQKASAPVRRTSQGRLSHRCRNRSRTGRPRSNRRGHDTQNDRIASRALTRAIKVRLAGLFHSTTQFPSASHRVRNAAAKPDSTRYINWEKCRPGLRKKLGVADGTRTHDDRNHNPGLYQLSYSHH